MGGESLLEVGVNSGIFGFYNKYRGASKYRRVNY